VKGLGRIVPVLENNENLKFVAEEERRRFHSASVDPRKEHSVKWEIEFRASFHSLQVLSGINRCVEVFV
jgi:hypothetical protein